MAAATVDEIKVLLKAQTAAFERKMKRAGKTVQKSGKQMEKSAKGASGQFKNLTSSVTLVNGPLSGVGARFQAANAIFTRTNFLLAGTLLAFAGLTAGLKKSITAFSQNERALGRIEALIKSTGGAANLTTKEIDDLAIAMDRATLGTRIGFLEASAVLLSFKEISGDAFTGALEGAANISEIMGTDLRSAALQLGKALQDPAIGLSMLRRAGVSFSPTARDVIIDFVNMGEKAKALDLILQGVEGQIGGAARGAAGGVAGAADDLGASLLDLSVTLGKIAADFLRLKEVAKSSASFFDRLNAIVGGLGKTIEEKPLGSLERELFIVNKRINDLERDITIIGKSLRGRFDPEGAGLNRMNEQLAEQVELFGRIEAQINKLRAAGDKPVVTATVDDELPEKVRKVIKELERETQALTKTGAELVFFNAMQKAGQKGVSKYAESIRAAADAFFNLQTKISLASEAVKIQIRLADEAEAAMFRQAEVGADIIIGQRREVETLTKLIAAQKKGNRERLIEERIIERLLQAKDANLDLSKEEIRNIRAQAAAIVDLEQTLEDVTESTVDWGEEIKDLNRRALETFQQNIIDVAAGTKSLGDAWRETGRIILNELNKIIVKMIFASNIGESGGGGIFGDILKGIFGFFTGGSSSGGGVSPDIVSSTTDAGFGPFQGGGRVTAGQTILGGERRPELFIPDQPGRLVSRIFPSMLESGGGTTLIFENNFSVGVAEAARREITAAMPQIIDAANEHVMRQINLGGREARVVQRKR